MPFSVSTVLKIFTLAAAGLSCSTWGFQCITWDPSLQHMDSLAVVHSMWGFSFPTRNRTCIPAPTTARWILNHWATREVLVFSVLWQSWERFQWIHPNLYNPASSVLTSCIAQLTTNLLLYKDYLQEESQNIQKRKTQLQ